MSLDVIIIIILVLPMAVGMRKGFIYSCVHALSWFAAAAAGIFMSGAVSDALRGSFIGTAIADGFARKMDSSVDSLEAAVDGMPEIIRGGLRVSAEGASDIFVNMMTATVISVLGFVIVVFFVKLVLRMLVRPVSRRDRGSILSKGDKLMGMAAGALQGLFLVFLFLACLIPVIDFMSGSAAVSVVSMLDSSVIARSLYDNNLLLVITGGFFS